MIRKKSVVVVSSELEDIDMRALPVVGDVICSSALAYGYRDHLGRHGVIAVDGHTRSYKMTFTRSEKERVRAAAKTGKAPAKYYVKDFGAYDKSRGSAKFVVIRAEMEGGSSGGGMNGHDDYPDGWNITARRLAPDGTYREDGELIRFYLSGCFTDQIDPKLVKTVGKMKQIFAPVSSAPL